MYKCRILPLYGTWDLVENETLPICRREMIMKMMPTMRMMAQMESFKNGEFEGIEENEMNNIKEMMTDMEKIGVNNDDDEECPPACEEGVIDIDISFTILTDENFDRGWNTWSQLPRNRTKYDVLFMELYFSSLRTQVKMNLYKQVDSSRQF